MQSQSDCLGGHACVCTGLFVAASCCEHLMLHDLDLRGKAKLKLRATLSINWLDLISQDDECNLLQPSHITYSNSVSHWHKAIGYTARSDFLMGSWGHARLILCRSIARKCWVTLLQRIQYRLGVSMLRLLKPTRLTLHTKKIRFVQSSLPVGCRARMDKWRCPWEGDKRSSTPRKEVDDLRSGSAKYNLAVITARRNPLTIVLVWSLHPAVPRLSVPQALDV